MSDIDEDIPEIERIPSRKQAEAKHYFSPQMSNKNSIISDSSRNVSLKVDD